MSQSCSKTRRKPLTGGVFVDEERTKRAFGGRETGGRGFREDRFRRKGGAIIEKKMVNRPAFRTGTEESMESSSGFMRRVEEK